MDNTSNPLTLQLRRPLSILTVEDTSDTLAVLNARLGRRILQDTYRILHDTIEATLDGYTGTKMLLICSWSMLTDNTDSPVF